MGLRGGVKQNFKLLHLRTSLVTGMVYVLLAGIFLDLPLYTYNCMRGGNQIPEIFDLLLPSVEVYL